MRTDEVLRCARQTGARFALLVALVSKNLAGAQPQAADDQFVAPAGQTAVLDVLANDASPEGEPLSVALDGSLSPPGAATVTVDDVAAQLVVVSPLNGYVGTVRFGYRARTESGVLSNQATVTVALGPVLLTRVDSAFATFVSARRVRLDWWDSSAAETHYHVYGGPSSTSLTRLTGAGGVPSSAGTTAGLFSWNDELANDAAPGSTRYYRIDACDNTGCVGGAVVSATYTGSAPANGAPTAVKDDVTLSKGGWKFVSFASLLSNDTDPTGESIRVTQVGGIAVDALPAGGTPIGCCLRLYPASDGITFWALSNFVTATLSYTISDGTNSATGSIVATAPAQVSVTACPDRYAPPQTFEKCWASPPTAENCCPLVAVPNLSTPEGRPKFFPYTLLLANDRPLDAPKDISTLTFSKPQHGRLEFCCGPQVGASAKLWNPPVGFWYIPDEEYVGDDTFYYTMFSGNSADSGGVTIRVTPDNVAPDPPAPAADNYVLPLVGSSSSSVLPAPVIITTTDLKLGFDFFDAQNPDTGDRLSFVRPPSSASPNLTWITPGYPDSADSLPLPADYEGAIRLSGTSSQTTFQYELRGAAPRPATGWPKGTVTFYPRNLPGSASAPPLRAIDDLFEVPAGKQLPISWIGLTANDYLRNQTPALPPLEPEFQYFAQPARGRITNVEAVGAFSYWAPTNYVGVDHFVYGVRSGAVAGQGRVVIKVLPGAPTAVTKNALCQAGGSVTIDLLAGNTDPQPEDVLSIAAVATPVSGSAVVGADGRTLTYAAAPADSAAQRVFGYTVRDNNGNTTEGVIRVAINHAPLTLDDAASLNTGADPSVTIAVLANDIDPDADTLTVSEATKGVMGGAVTINSDATITYRWPFTTAFRGDSFTYTASDGRGGRRTGRVIVGVESCRDCEPAGQ